MLTVLQNTDYK